MSYFKPLREELKTYLDPQQIKAVHAAYLLGAKAHQTQKRHTGEPYITHPIEVAHILATLRLDHQTIIAALLHDVIEDTTVTKEQLFDRFGKEVADLVDGVSKLTQINFESREQAHAENFRKMILAMAQDIRVILIKLADRLHNMRTLGALPSHKRQRIAKETLEIFAPIANRLGMHQFRLEFEDLGFANLYPERYRVLRQVVRRARGNRREIMRGIEKTLCTALDRIGVVHYHLASREKHLYSIFRKMRDKHLSFSEVMDIYGFRITTDNVDACYRVLGVVHNLYKPIPQRFKDYIAIPKVNGYQSLHTTLFGPYGVPIEIQIRTREMDRIAESGVAAHWIYKSQKDFNVAHVQAHEWIRNMVEMQNSANTPVEFIENLKTDLFPDEVYVFTPKGQIMKLPQGVTGIDFAYAVHSDIGDTCVAIKIDRHLAALSTPLESGQTIEVITSPQGTPNPLWLNFVVTGKAKSNIRHFLKTQKRQESVALGKRLLMQALQALGCADRIFSEAELHTVLTRYGLSTLEDLHAEIGFGNRTALMVAKQLTQMDLSTTETQALSVQGTEGMVMQFATCCRPIPGDPIIGILDQGKGIMVHTEHCPASSTRQLDLSKRVILRWEEGVQGVYPVDIIVEMVNKPGILAGLTIVIAEMEANINNISAEDVDGQYFTVYLTLAVRSRQHLAHILRRIRRVPGLLHVARRKVSPA